MSRIRPFVRPFVRLSVRLSIRPSVRPPVRLCIRAFVHASVCVFVRLSAHLTAQACVCPSTFLCVCPSPITSVHLPVLSVVHVLHAHACPHICIQPLVHLYENLHAQVWVSANDMPKASFGTEIPAIAGGGGKVYAAGGYLSPNVICTLEIYDCATDAWVGICYTLCACKLQAAILIFLIDAPQSPQSTPL